MRSAVNEMILEEMARMDAEGRRADDYLSLSSSSSSSSVPPGPDDPTVRVASARVHAELDRLARGEGRPAGEGVQQAGGSAAGSSAPAAPAAGAAADPEAWDGAVRRAQAALEAQALRALNLELMAKYGVDAWRAHVGDADRLVASARARVLALQGEADAVNAARRATQEPQAGRLKTLARRYTDGVASNFQTELACADAEAEVKRLRRLVEERGAGGGGGAEEVTQMS
jgi:hypothetical protein